VDAGYADSAGLVTSQDTHGVEVIDVAIGALAAQPQVVSVIAGATTPEQAAANARAGRWTPSASDLAEIDRITRPRAAA